MHQLIKLGVRLGVAIGVLALLFRFVPVAAVVEPLADLHPIYLLAGLLLQYVLRAVATVRMKVIADNQGFRLTHGVLFRVLLASHFYSMLLPGPIAGGGATWVKYVQHGASQDAAVMAILINRGVAMLVMVVVGAAALFLDLRAAQTWSTVAAGLVAVALLALANAGWLSRLPVAAPAGASRPRRVVHGLAERALLFSRIPPGGKALVLVASLVHEVIGAGVMWCFAAAAGLELSFLTVLWIRAALQLVLTLPLSLGGLGIREAGLVGLGALVDVPAAGAVAWSLTIFLGSLVVAATGGLLEAGGLSGRLLRIGRGPDPEPGGVGAGQGRE
jgi:glycosyltransferase 2 family protein